MKAPERCFLQWHGDATEDQVREYDEDPDWKPDEGEATWCQDRVFDADVEYVRADLVAERDAEIARLRVEVEQLLSDNAVQSSIIDDWEEDMAAERQRARLPEDLASRIRTAVDFDLHELRNGAVVPRLLRDIHAAVESDK